MPSLLVRAVLAIVLVLSIPATASATSYTDPASDNCMTGVGSNACGVDFLTVSDTTNADGSVTLTATFSGTECITDWYPAATTQPSFHFFPASTGTPNASMEKGVAWAASGSTTYSYTPARGTDTALTATVVAGSVTLTIPASITTTLGVSFDWMVTNSCRSHPSDAKYSDGDIAPDTGLYTGTSEPPITNTGGDGSSTDSTKGDSGANTFTGSASADTWYGLGGNDVFFGKGGNDVFFGGAGNDTANGGAGADKLNGDGGKDTLTGGKGKDTLKGGAGNDTLLANDKVGGETVNCGAGSGDKATVDKKDRTRGCEKVTVK
jgi:hypothetical protein